MAERVIHRAVVEHDGSDLAARLADVVARSLAAAFDDDDAGDAAGEALAEATPLHS